MRVGTVMRLYVPHWPAYCALFRSKLATHRKDCELSFEVAWDALQIRLSLHMHGYITSS